MTSHYEAYLEYISALRETGSVDDAVHATARRLRISIMELNELLDEALAARGDERVYAETRSALERGGRS